MRRSKPLAVLAVVTAACGDNSNGVGPPLEPAESMFVVAHLDDDMIFMQPQLANALAHGSSTTVYVTSGDPLGREHAEHTFNAAMIAYEHATRSTDWDCGYIVVADLPVHHCRLLDRRVSIIGLDVAEGGRNGERQDSLLHLVEHTVSSLPLLGPIDGRVTVESLVAELAEIITATAPRELHTLDYSAVHGDDHSGHMIAASFAMWAVASAGYRGTLVSHRGYNVGNEPTNLSDADYAFVKPMIGYFEACYWGCAPCGTECPRLEKSHEQWVRRQYSASASTRTTTARLGNDAVPGACLAVLDDGSLGMVDGPTAVWARLRGDGRLHVAGMCVATDQGNDDPIMLVPCADDPAQYWLLDDEGFLWNGRPPTGVTEMDFDHVRCLHVEPGATASAPICGSRRKPRWRMMP